LLLLWKFMVFIEFIEFIKKNCQFIDKLFFDKWTHSNLRYSTSAEVSNSKTCDSTNI
jgi:hypothetical protein